MNRIAAVILAAGSGRRIGIPKLKLQLDGEYFINIIISKLITSGIIELVSIVRADDTEWLKENAISDSFIVNKEPELGMLSSVKLGIKHFLDTDGIMIFPVDHPFVSIDTIKGLKEAFVNDKSKIIKPFVRGKSGHPLVVPSSVFELILNGSGDEKLNNIINGAGIDIYRYETEDDGIVRNVNFPEELPGTV